MSDTELVKTEKQYLSKMYSKWKQIQGLADEMSSVLNLKHQTTELTRFDLACCAMEYAFGAFEAAVKLREEAL